MLKKLNVGCGNEILRGYVNLDIAELPGVDVVHDLNKLPWPFEDNRFEEIRIIHVLEHLPDTVRIMEELWRISNAGCKVIVCVPYWNSWRSVGDPTHVKGFHQKTFDFFDPNREHGKMRSYYTHARFEIAKISYWLHLLPQGRGWVCIGNGILKWVLAFFATYLNNIICAVEFELIALKEQG
jgi:hypothetical protein